MNAVAALTASTADALFTACVLSEQLSVYVLLPTVVGETLNVPLDGCAPIHAPLAMQFAALDDQVSVALCPCVMAVGATVIATVAAGGP